jgi:hypothetical protein
MNCVCTVSYKVKINQGFTEEIKPERGLRQGCPLSPYLFILCVEGLSCLFQKVADDGSLDGIQICPDAPKINHMFFADDSLIFMKVNEASAKKLQSILRLYEVASGQMINKDKSVVMFSKGTSNAAKRRFLSTLNISAEAYNERYPGLPVYLSKSKSKSFAIFWIGCGRRSRDGSKRSFLKLAKKY